jgi:fucose 4-O-acetylase-like acetyltransferase
MSNRIEYIDVAKGIGIFLVVLGHNQIKATLPALAAFIYTFHMPMFFLLSGMFFKANMGFFELLRRRFHTLLQPYLVIILLMYITAFLFSETQSSLILLHLAKAAYASGNYLDWAQLWFLPALFAVNIFVYLLFKLIYGRLPALWMRALFLGGMLWIGVATLKTFWKYKINLLGKPLTLDGLPFSLDLLLVIGAFFLIGYEMYRYVPEKFYRSWWVFFVSGLILVGLNLFFKFRVDLFSRSYQSFVINSLEALSGSIFVLCLSKHIADTGGWFSQVWQYLGRVSLVLLIFHGPIQFYTYYKIDDWISNPYIVAFLSFVLALGVPLLIYEWLIRPNPIVATWFGMERLSPAKESSE